MGHKSHHASHRSGRQVGLEEHRLGEEASITFQDRMTLWRRTMVLIKIRSFHRTCPLEDHTLLHLITATLSNFTISSTNFLWWVDAQFLTTVHKSKREDESQHTSSQRQIWLIDSASTLTCNYSRILVFRFFRLCCILDVHGLRHIELK